MVLKPCQSYLPELLWHFMSQLHGLVVRCLFGSAINKKRNFWGSWFPKFKFDFLLVNLLICSQKTYSAPCVLYRLNHLSWIMGFKYISPSFWTWVTNHDVYTSLLHKLQAQTLPDAAPPKGKTNPFCKIVVTSEPVMLFWRLLRYGIS